MITIIEITEMDEIIIMHKNIKKRIANEIIITIIMKRRKEIMNKFKVISNKGTKTKENIDN